MNHEHNTATVTQVTGANIVVDQTTIDRVAAAIESAELGYSMRQVRLVDGINTYTLTIDGMPTEEFTDNEDGEATDQVYARIREVKRRKQAEAVIAALAPPTVVPSEIEQAHIASVEWKFCPECGSDEIHHEEGNHKQCKECHQEWFSNLDYYDVVAKNRFFIALCGYLRAERTAKQTKLRGNEDADS